MGVVLPNSFLLPDFVFKSYLIFSFYSFTDVNE